MATATLITLEALLEGVCSFGRYHLDPETGEPCFLPNRPGLLPEPEDQFLKRSAKLVAEFKDKIAGGYLLSPGEGERVGRWMHMLHPVLAVAMWANLQLNVKNLFMVHPHVNMLMVFLSLNAEYIPSLERYMMARASLKELGFEE